MDRMDGVLVIDKHAGVTSHDVIDKVRRILHVRRVGHTGTLDPFATGVLVVLVGRATRLAQFLSGVEKEYEAVIRLGFATDTGDVTGKRIHKPENQIATQATSIADVQSKPGQTGMSVLPGWSREQIEAALESLRGEIDQVPPMYSAKKQGGRKLYELARRGEEVERKPVRVCIHEFEAIKPTGELLKDNLDGTFDFEVRVVCSSGTYVRTLAEDFGKRLQVGAHLAELRRTRVGDFEIQQAQTLEQMKLNVADEALGRVMLPTDAALARFPVMDLNADDVRRAQNGMPVHVSGGTWGDGERVRMRDAQGHLIAVAEFNATAGSLHPSVVIARDN
ncbi:MAG TPA: tRNA pseudouridine(55) synthase TruB [Pyrinomonadaceae bacterium]|jgi:tRNA pseudouridine55 synthase|nr:tRNA pseudouridine(55) synthase TruB [Pyrinomonadaceae bacterium]